MHWTHDVIADALYVAVVPAAGVASTREFAPWLLVDEDEAGNPIGMEILSVSKANPESASLIMTVFPNEVGQWIADVAGWVRQHGTLQPSTGRATGSIVFVPDESVEVQVHSDTDFETALVATRGLQFA